MRRHWMYGTLDARHRAARRHRCGVASMARHIRDQPRRVSAEAEYWDLGSGIWPQRGKAKFDPPSRNPGSSRARVYAESEFGACPSAR
jgi:hypothetical protein